MTKVIPMQLCCSASNSGTRVDGPHPQLYARVRFLRTRLNPVVLATEIE